MKWQSEQVSFVVNRDERVKKAKYSTYPSSYFSSSSALWCHWFIRMYSERFVQRDRDCMMHGTLERKGGKKSYEGERDLLDKHAQTATNCLMLDFACSGGKAKLDQTIYAVARSSSCFYFARFDVRKQAGNTLSSQYCPALMQSCASFLSLFLSLFAFTLFLFRLCCCRQEQTLSIAVTKIFRFSYDPCNLHGPTMVQSFWMTRSNDVITTPQLDFHENEQRLNRWG